MWAGENRSDVEAELESEEPMEMGGDASTSKDDKDRDVVVTSVVCLWPCPSVVGRIRRGAATFPHQGSVSQAQTPLSSERQSGRGRRALQRCYWLCTLLL